MFIIKKQRGLLSTSWLINLQSKLGVMHSRGNYNNNNNNNSGGYNSHVP